MNTPQQEDMESSLREAQTFAAELRKWWSFDDGQQHTHSWHSREDFIEKKLPALLRLHISSATPGLAKIVEEVATDLAWAAKVYGLSSPPCTAEMIRHANNLIEAAPKLLRSALSPAQRSSNPQQESARGLSERGS